MDQIKSYANGALPFEKLVVRTALHSEKIREIITNAINESNYNGRFEGDKFIFWKHLNFGEEAGFYPVIEGIIKDSNVEIVLRMNYFGMVVWSMILVCTGISSILILSIQFYYKLAGVPIKVINIMPLFGIFFFVYVLGMLIFEIEKRKAKIFLRKLFE